MSLRQKQIRPLIAAVLLLRTAAAAAPIDTTDEERWAIGGELCRRGALDWALVRFQALEARSARFYLRARLERYCLLRILFRPAEAYLLLRNTRYVPVDAAGDRAARREEIRFLLDEFDRERLEEPQRAYFDELLKSPEFNDREKADFRLLRAKLELEQGN